MKTYLKLNNEVLNRYSTTGQLELEKDREATRRYFLEYVNVRLRYFIDIEEKIRYLVDEGYYEKQFIDMYDIDFIKHLYKSIRLQFPFPFIYECE